MTTTAGRVPHSTRPENADPCGQLTALPHPRRSWRRNHSGAGFRGHDAMIAGRECASDPDRTLRGREARLLLTALQQLVDRRAHVEDGELGGPVGALLV